LVGFTSGSLVGFTSGFLVGFTSVSFVEFTSSYLVGFTSSSKVGLTTGSLVGLISHGIDSHGCFMLKSLRVTEAHECTAAAQVDKKLTVQMFDLVTLISSLVYTTAKTWIIYYCGILTTSPSHLRQRNYSGDIWSIYYGGA
jgi:hypothetical protein